MRTHDPLRPYWIADGAPPDAFPDVAFALDEPEGLLAIGGDLSPARLLAGYRRGIFPWYSEGQPILWWSPNPRAVLVRDELVVPRSLKKRVRQNRFRCTFDQAFEAVIRGCAAPRRDEPGTWITDEMLDAYCRLAALGIAHSVECWRDDQLVGGLYGVALGEVFFGESMFSKESDASKIAFLELCKAPFALIDCQQPSSHMMRLGAREIPRQQFVELLDQYADRPTVTLDDGTCV
ncbi:MAG: leucyl/phenylalanyl-tRNA--protein transferase [Gammaproteobacteria bacterium]|nr:leucyl/phenylalanyl-tRNA--protein transferase [Gammaproteobacteria bacterium]